MLAFLLALALQDDFTPLFNGKDLAGWAPMNVPESTFTVRDGIIVCTGKPTGLLRTEKQYENYILELEWKHLHEGGNAGLFVHSAGMTAVGAPFSKSIEVQVMLGDDKNGNYTRHGDIFSIWGAKFIPDRPHPAKWERCLPSENRVKPAGEWNHYRVVCQDGVIKLQVNGKEVSGGTNCTPRKGYICLEAEGSECHFRNLRIKELPSSNPPAADVADLAEPGFVPIFNGIDLTGWKADASDQGNWTVKHNWLLDYNGKGKDLWSEKEYKDFILIADWRLPRRPVEKENPVIDADGNETGKQKVLDAGDSGIYLRGSSKSQVNIWSWPCGSGEVYGYRTDKSMSAEVRKGVTPRVNADAKPGAWNRFVITMKGDRLTVVLNGQTVLENAQLPGVKEKGPIALQNHGDPIQFGNLFIKELP